MPLCASVVACAARDRQPWSAGYLKPVLLSASLAIIVAGYVGAQSAQPVRQSPIPAGESVSAELIPLPPVQNDMPFALADAEQLAMVQNPSLARAAAVVRAARGQWLQSGLMPDPTLNIGEAQIASLGREEQDFAGVTQTFVTAGKRTLSRAAAAADVAKAEHDFIAQRNRVLTDVRTAFYDLLIANEQLATSQRLLQISRDAVATAKKVAKDETGQNDILEAEIEQYNAEINLRTAQNRVVAAKTNLGAIVGNPQARFDNLLGEPDALPAPRDWQQSLNQLLNRSPELAAGAADAEQSRWALQRAQAQRIPDVAVQGLINWRDNGIGGRSDGALQFSVPLPVWNRNRGNIATAEADVIAASQALETRRLELQQRLAIVFESYKNARQQTALFRDRIIPAAHRALELTNKNFANGKVEYDDVLTSQRTNATANLSYLDALREFWHAEFEIDGLLLSGSMTTAAK